MSGGSFPNDPPQRCGICPSSVTEELFIYGKFVRQLSTPFGVILAEFGAVLYSVAAALFQLPAKIKADSPLAVQFLL
jgi:hypothetical protein